MTLTWMDKANALMGEGEVIGPKENPMIRAMFKAVDYDISDVKDADTVPWCGAFVGYVMQEDGHPMAALAARALSWATYGDPCEPKHGAIAVVENGEGGHHVAFIYQVTETNLYLLGGNQGNRVSIVKWPRAKLVACRWPPGAKQLEVAGSRIVSEAGVVQTVAASGAVVSGVAASVDPQSLTQTLSVWTGLGTSIQVAIDLVSRHWIVPATMACVALYLASRRIIKSRLEDQETGKTVP